MTTRAAPGTSRSISGPRSSCYAESAVDVVRAVRFARSHGLRIAPQGNGPRRRCRRSQLGGAMLLKTARMRRVHVDAQRCGSRDVSQAGAQWEDVAAPAGEHGLAALAGTSPNVGVTGYTLGGGMGWLSRRYGLAANSVTAVEVVIPGRAASCAPTPNTSPTCSGRSGAAAGASGW